jgi:hypothetical protein
MAEAIKGLFSSAPDIGRANPFGLIVMILSVLLAAFAGRLARLFPEKKRAGAAIALKLSSLVVCAAGAAISVL